MPYFGTWPSWFTLYLESCGANPTVEWVFLTNCGAPEKRPPNTRFINLTWCECVHLVRTACPKVAAPLAPYKLCDFRFAYADIFHHYADGADYVGFGDIDVIYGALRDFLTPEVLQYDLLTFNMNHVSGHFSLLRNTPEVILRYRDNDGWLKYINEPNNCQLDERNGYYGLNDVYVTESFNTPFSPYVRWTNNRLEFPYAWYYRNGHLYNSLDGDRQFMYLHFMRYKYLWQAPVNRNVVHFDAAKSASQWKLLLDGFYRWNQDDEVNERTHVVTLDGSGRPLISPIIEKSTRTASLNV
jgi:hypothetical protein